MNTDLNTEPFNQSSDWKNCLELLAQFLPASVAMLERQNGVNNWVYISENAESRAMEWLNSISSSFYGSAAKQMSFLYPDKNFGPYYIQVITLNVVPARDLTIWLIQLNQKGFSNKEKTLIAQSTKILEQEFSSQGFFSGKGIQVSGGYFEDSEQYRIVIENSPVGIFFYNKNLIITLANERFCSTLGVPIEKLIGFDINNITDTRVIPAILDSLNGREGIYEGTYQTTISNKLVNILLKTAPVYNRQNKITGGIGIFQDLTEQHNIKKAREESDMRFMLVAMHTNDVIFEWNSQTNLFQWHGNIKSIVGTDRKPKSLNEFIDKIHPDDRTKMMESWSSHKLDNLLWKEEFRLVLSNGTQRHIKGSGINAFSEDGHLKTLGTLTDITHEKELVQSLKEALDTARNNHAKAQSLLSVIPDLYFVFDKDGYFRDFHTESEARPLIKPEFFLNQPVDKVLPPELATLTNEKIKSTLLLKKMETYTYALNNQIFESRMVPYMDDMVITIVRDITQAKAIEKELLTAKEKAEESDRLKSSFLANMSHEIRTPLNGIMGFAELLQSEDILPENRNFYLDLILQSGQQLLGVINDVLEISKIETGQISLYKTNINIKELITSLLAIFEIRATEKKIKLKTSLPKIYTQHTINTDLQKITQIFNNLLGNAIKFTRINGIITFGYKTIKSEYCFFVQDNGIGIDSKYHQLIFERFRQAENDSQADKSGSGLGLSISKSLVELMGGRIWVESEPGKGSTFFFTLPK